MMAKLTQKDVEHVAKLAKLPLTPGEVTKFQKQLSSIVDYISELNQVDTNGVEPTSQTTSLTNVFRADMIKKSFNQNEALSGTEEVHNDFFVSKRVVDK